MMRRRALLASSLVVVATPSLAQPNGQLDQAVAEFAQGKPVQRGRVKLEMEKLVDNGNLVPVSVTVESPMTAADHVVAIGIFNDRNPQRDVARFVLGPRSGKAAVATRMRLATSQKLAAVARMSDGSVWIDTVDVVVALAACIEGDVN
ncbi:SoxY-related AACIE arm protein [Ramlibacter sp. GTP1]|uniref:SoxY-related AACIE arm protein n=2 Tax=Ramlibacter albus TaxID=2079448 RepID=A0A923M9J4_9BURK|nr:SoxY-related AACIE arm protein [Ramlibacter albus]